MKRTTFLRTIALLVFSFVVSHQFLCAQVTLIPYGSNWKYWSNTQANFQNNWQTTAYNDGAWPTGNGELGYGDGDEATCIPSGGGGTLCAPTGNKWVTAYFRYTVNIPDVNIFSNFTLNVERDDGCVVYVNGVEAGRNNMPVGPVAWGTAASSAIEDAVASFTIPAASFVNGNNVIAVEVHQATVSGTPPTTTSSDLSFNLELIGNDAFSGTVTRGPYLQMGNQTEITIRWRTSAAQNSRIELGTVFGTYPIVVNDAASVTEHIVRVTGLSPDTKYYYRIGNSTNMGMPDAEKFFRTVPPAGVSRKIRIAAFGDCGRNSATYQDQNLTNYRNYLTTNGIDAPDAWILMGDNAYTTGTDAEYSSNFFGIYGTNLLKNHKLYPAPGNHDYGNNTGNKGSRAMPYYSNFTVPQAGECGGVASTKPNFYSFDIGDVHFLSLDSWGIESDGTHMGTAGASMMKTWINNDLAANTKKWVIAYWHHSPYTMTSHNSDSEGELAAIRTSIVTYLEQRGVDLVLCGHSHGYERSYLLRNYTSGWLAFNKATHTVDSSSATYTSNTTCPYTYSSSALNHGTVYVVAGSAGASGGVQTNFATGPMPFAVNDAGLFFIEVDSNRLDAKMLRRNGTVFDQFTMMKDVNKTTNYSIVAGNPVTLQASWPGNYTWSTGATTAAITVNPPIGVHNFSVTDNFNCVTDNFTVTVNGTLPVSLSGYTAALVNGKVNVNWTTASESGTSHFLIERSADGRLFESIGRVSAAGNSSSSHAYTFTDPLPLKGISYYRLVQVDQNQHAGYFEQKRILNTNGKGFYAKQITEGPGVLSLEIHTAQNGRLQLEVFDAAGRKIVAESFAGAPGILRKKINLPSGAQYICRVSGNRGETVTLRVQVP